MGADEVAVLAGAVAAIGWVNWFFFGSAKKEVRAAEGQGGVQQVTVSVRGGYEPSVVRVRAGAPVRLVFDRQETSGCSEEVLIPELGIRRFLPAHEKTAVEFEVDRSGSYEFTCGMGMLRGRLLVEDAEAAA